MPEDPRSKRRGWDRFSLTVCGRKQHWQHLDFGLLASRTVRQYISVILSHPVCDICYGCPSKLIYSFCGMEYWFPTYAIIIGFF